MDNHETDGPEVFVDQAEGQVVDDLLDNAGAGTRLLLLGICLRLEDDLTALA